MHIIGIVGGVASGKSLIAAELVRLGAGLLDADQAGHDVLRLPQIEAALCERWGDEIRRPDGLIDRARLAKIVFADPPDGPRQRQYLEQLTHPEIGRLLQQRSAAMAAAGKAVAVLDAPLLLEAGWGKICDYLIFVDAPRQVRLDRALARGWNEEEFFAREAAQQSLDSKRSLTESIIDNSQSLEHTRTQLARFWQSHFD